MGSSGSGVVVVVVVFLLLLSAAATLPWNITFNKKSVVKFGILFFPKVWFSDFHQKWFLNHPDTSEQNLDNCTFGHGDDAGEKTTYFKKMFLLLLYDLSYSRKITYWVINWPLTLWWWFHTQTKV